MKRDIRLLYPLIMQMAGLSVSIAYEMVAHHNFENSYVLDGLVVGSFCNGGVVIIKNAGLLVGSTIGKLADIIVATRAGKEYVQNTLNLKSSKQNLNLFNYILPSPIIESDEHHIMHSFGRTGASIGMTIAALAIGCSGKKIIDTRYEQRHPNQITHGPVAASKMPILSLITIKQILLLILKILLGNKV